MHFLELTLPTLEENLALDEALLLEAEAARGGEVLRFWEWPSLAVVLGAGGRLAQEVDEKACEQDDVPIRRRSSGGGTVLLGRGCLLYSLVLAYARAEELREILSSYRFVLKLIRNALLDTTPGVEFAGTSDLCVAGKKFSGNSQQRKRNCLLHHGTVLYDFGIGEIGRYLREPDRQPKYRRGRAHEEFVTNLPVAAATLKECIRSAWQTSGPLADWPKEASRRLVLEKYRRDDWNRRR